MDPSACWARLLAAIEDGDAEEAREAAGDLASWIRRGGYSCEVDRQAAILRMRRALTQDSPDTRAVAIEREEG